MKDVRSNQETNVKWPSALLIGIRQAAALLGISERKLWEMANSGKMPCLRIGTRLLFSPNQLRQWVDNNMEGGQ